MTEWTAEELLYFDIAHALRKVKIPGVRKALTEEQRMAIARTVLEHLNQCRWEFNTTGMSRLTGGALRRPPCCLMARW